MKLAGIDYGEKRVGLASTDESGEFAIPRKVLDNDESLLKNILEFIQSENIERVVIGESKNFKGEPNKIMERINEFKKKLEGQSVDVVLHTETFTTMEARQIQGNTKMTDASAASLILKSYIDTNK